MSKPALGRGLGSLLPNQGNTSTAENSSTKVTLGVATLISGNRTAESSETAPPPLTPPETFTVTAHRTRLRWMLVTADLLLCGMAAAILLRKTTPVRPEEAALCIAAILLGAWLGCSALTLGRNPPQ